MCSNNKKPRFFVENEGKRASSPDIFFGRTRHKNRLILDESGGFLNFLCGFVFAVLDSSTLVQLASKIMRFEEYFCEYIGVSFVCAFDDMSVNICGCANLSVSYFAFLFFLDFAK